jgi:hypothetical protein
MPVRIYIIHTLYTFYLKDSQLKSYNKSVLSVQVNQQQYDMNVHSLDYRQRVCIWSSLEQLYVCTFYLFIFHFL